MLAACFLLLESIGIGLTIWSGVAAQDFLRRHRSIADRAALEDFKRLARLDMYLALVGIPVLGSAILLGMWLMWRSGTFGFLLFLGANCVLGVASVLGRSLVKRVRSLPVEDELADEYRRVGRAWLTRPLPNF